MVANSVLSLGNYCPGQIYIGPNSRFMGAAIPAAFVTLCLAFLMSSLVSTDFELRPRDQVREIERVIPLERDSIAARTYDPPQQIEAAIKPPPLPPYRATKSEIDVSAYSYRGRMPVQPDFELDTLVTRVPIDLRPQPQPLEPLLVSYPERPLRQGIEGECLVRFDIGVTGLPSNVVADCTSPGFEREAHRAVSRTRFAPKIVDGRAVEQSGVAYPIVFRLSDQ